MPTSKCQELWLARTMSRCRPQHRRSHHPADKTRAKAGYDASAATVAEHLRRTVKGPSWAAVGSCSGRPTSAQNPAAPISPHATPDVSFPASIGWSPFEERAVAQLGSALHWG